MPNSSFLRIILAVSPAQQAHFEQYLYEMDHEVVAVEAHGETALRAARLVYPDVVVLNGPLRGTLDGMALAAALRSCEVLVVLATDPIALPTQPTHHFQR